MPKSKIPEVEYCVGCYLAKNQAEAFKRLLEDVYEAEANPQVKPEVRKGREILTWEVWMPAGVKLRNIGLVKKAFDAGILSNLGT